MDKTYRLKQWKAYINGSLHQRGKKAFDEAIANDSFLAEAMDGYKEYPEEIEQAKVFKKYFSRRKKIWVKRILVSTAFVVATIVVVYWLLSHSENNEKLTSINSSQTNEVNWAELKKEIEQSVVIPETLQIKPKDKKQEQQEIIKFEKSSTQEEIQKIQTIAIKSITNLSKPEENIKRHFKLLPTTYYYDLKVVVYDKSRRSKIKMRINDEGTLSPQFENYENMIQKDGINWTYISYEEFLEEAMGKFSKSLYKEALLDYHYILKLYEHDLNAYFYGGLCYYNLGMYDKALLCFDEILKDNSLNFMQEALWYKALSLYYAGRIEEATALFADICISKGFYSSKACDLMKKATHE